MREVIEGAEDESDGVKTDLGWSIVGGLNKSVGICHRIHVTEVPQITPKDVLCALQADVKNTQPHEVISR